MWDYTNCADFSTNSSRTCCQSKIRSIYEEKDARFVECINSQQPEDEEICEEWFPLRIQMNCGQNCEIDFRHSLGAKCIQDAKGNCVPLKFQKTIAQKENIAQNKC